MVFTFDAPAGGAMCDFCSAPTARLFGSRNFLLPNTRYPIFQRGPIGAWSACDRCALLINAGRWSLLTDRAVRRYMNKYQVPQAEEPEVRSQFAHTYQRFKENMIRDN